MCFSHAQEVYYPFENGTYFMCNGLGEDPECQDTRSVEKDYTFEQFTYGFGNIHTAYFGTSFDNLSGVGATCFFTFAGGRVPLSEKIRALLWMDEILYHLRNPGMMIPPPANTNAQ